MSTSFLEGFSEALVDALLRDQHIEIEPGSRHVVAEELATRLAVAPEGRSLISTLAQVLIEIPAITELFADDETLKELVTELPPTVLPRGGR